MADSPVHRGVGVELRADLVEAFVFRRQPGGAIELLQMRRSARASVSAGTWQPVLGHLEIEETATEAIQRELLEETGLTRESRLGLWQLEQVHPFFIAETNAIYFCPRFVVEVSATWEPVLNDEHEAHRWVQLADADRLFAWPGQRAAIAEFVNEIARPTNAATSALRLE